MQPNPLNSPVIQVIQVNQEKYELLILALEHHPTDATVEKIPFF